MKFNTMTTFIISCFLSIPVKRMPIQRRLYSSRSSSPLWLSSLLTLTAAMAAATAATGVVLVVVATTRATTMAMAVATLAVATLAVASTQARTCKYQLLSKIREKISNFLICMWREINPFSNFVKSIHPQSAQSCLCCTEFKIFKS